MTNAAGEVVRRDDFEAPYSSMVHDFLTTRGHVLFPILPLTGSLERAMKGQMPYAWEPEKGAFVGVMARNASVETIRWFEVDACYVFHPMNAWEEGTKIFADVMEYPVAPLFPRADGGRSENTAARLVRWTIDLAGDSNKIKREPLDDMAGEFPRFDERRAGLSYRHGWFAANTERPGDVRFDAIAHVDLASGKRIIHELGAGDATGEPIFIPRSAERGRGDGWVISGGLSRPRGSQRLPGVRRPGYLRRPDRHGQDAPPRAVRLPRQLAKRRGRGRCSTLEARPIFAGWPNAGPGPSSASMSTPWSIWWSMPAW